MLKRLLFFSCLFLGFANARTQSEKIAFWPRIGNAALQSVTSPLTWAPGLAALTCYTTPLDHNISEWASTRNPVFGSIENAQQSSDFLLTLSRYSCLVSTSALLVDYKRVGKFENVKLPIGMFASAGLAVSASSVSTTWIKGTTGRTRPDGGDNRSFPSGHTAMATVYSTVSVNNIHALKVSRPVETLLNTTFFTVAAGTAWARVEGKKHYPSDVLAGAALGHFIGTFFSNVFMGTSKPELLNIKADVINNRYALNFVVHLK